MKISTNWVNDFVKIDDVDKKELADKITNAGVNVQEVIGEVNFDNIVVGEIVSAKAHENSDHLKVCEVNIGKSTEQIVCGAPNARSGIKVVVSLPGAVLPNGMEIKQSVIRGVSSNGMLCSERELGLGEDHKGIIELPDNAKLGENIADILKLNDPIIEISITPNRGDCLSVYGIARDLACAGLGKLKELEDVKIKENIKSSIKLNVIDKNCPVFYFREVNNLQNCESPNWLKNRLKSIDINPKNALVDITNYVIEIKTELENIREQIQNVE